MLYNFSIVIPPQLNYSMNLKVYRSAACEFVYEMSCQGLHFISVGQFLRQNARASYIEQQEFYSQEQGLNMDLRLDGVMLQPAANIPPTGALYANQMKMRRRPESHAAIPKYEAECNPYISLLNLIHCTYTAWTLKIRNGNLQAPENPKTQTTLNFISSCNPCVAQRPAFRHVI